MQEYELSCFRGFVCLASECPDTCCQSWEVVLEPETLEKYHDNFENANKFFTSLMEKEGVEYYNYNYQEISGFDRSLNGFSDYEGHMYEEQSDVFSEEIGKIMRDM